MSGALRRQAFSFYDRPVASLNAASDRMQMDEPMSNRNELKPFQGLRRWLSEEAGRAIATPVDALRNRLANRAERVLGLVERAAALEVHLLERLAPIVDNLGELVRLQLEEARRRRPEAPPADQARHAGQTIIDVEIVTTRPPERR